MPHYYEQPCEHAGATPFCPCGTYQRIQIKGTVTGTRRVGILRRQKVVAFDPGDHEGWFLVLPVEKPDMSSTA